ncbi:MAG: hypothetical protein ACC656_12415 [Candidatus Heimdallarchaeota archaeon]
MSSTTIRIEKTDKEKIDKLQAEIFLKIDKKLTVPEILHYLIRFGRENLIEGIQNELNVQKAIDWDHAFSFIQDFGFDSSEDIDEIVYG